MKYFILVLLAVMLSNCDNNPVAPDPIIIRDTVYAPPKDEDVIALGKMNYRCSNFPYSAYAIAVQTEGEEVNAYIEEKDNFSVQFMSNKSTILICILIEPYKVYNKDLVWIEEFLVVSSISPTTPLTNTIFLDWNEINR